MKPNREFIIVFQPYNKEHFSGRRRFYVGASSLFKYIGKDNADKVIKKALSSKNQKDVYKFRAHGAVYFYTRTK